MGVCHRPHPRRGCARGVWHATGLVHRAEALVCIPQSAPGRGSGRSSPRRQLATVRGAIGACVAAGRRGCVSRQGTWGSSCAGHAATGPMVTAATADASDVRSVGLYCRSPVVSRARCLQAAIQATAPQFVQSGSAPSAPSLPPCCTVVAVSSGGPCCSASGSSPGGRAGWTGCGEFCAHRRSGCVWYGFCRRCSGAARGWKRSWFRYQWPYAVDGLRSVSHCSTSPPGCAASTRRCNPRRPRRLDVPAGGMWVCG